MIELQRLSKRYGDRLAVDDLTFAVQPGLVTGFLGPNGAGKSTTMRMILGLDRPTGGRVLVDGQCYDRLVKPLTHVGALLEAKAAQQGRSAYNHLLWLARSNRIPERRVAEVLDAVGLRDAARKRIGGYSLGMGQRLGIAAALLGDPAVLLLDEPVNGLDPEGIVWIRTLIRSLAAEGRTVLVSSHLMSEMALTADHLIVIGRGRLLADLPMGEFIDRNSRSHVRVMTDQPEVLMDALDGEAVAYRRGADGAFEAVGVEPGRIAKLASSRGLVLSELSLQRASLEEAFMEMTADAVEYQAGPATSAATAAPAAPTTSEYDQRKRG